MIYLDDASTSFPKPTSVHEAVLSAVRDLGGNPGRGGHSKAREADRLVFDTRELVARLFDVSESSRVIFTPGCTYSINVAVKSLVGSDDHVIVGPRQHNAVVRTLESVGCSVSKFDWEGNAPFDRVKFSSLLTDKTKAVIINHGGNVDGLLTPPDEIRELCGDIPLIIDCAQTAGALEIKTGEREIVCAPGHKGLWGTAGVGIMAFGKKIDLDPLVFGGTGSFSDNPEMPTAYPDRLEPGTMNLPGIASLNAGVKEVLSTGVKNIFEKKTRVVETAFERLSKIQGLRIFRPAEAPRRLPLFSFTIEGMDPSDIATALDSEHGIAVRSGLHCAPNAHREIGTFPEGAVRFSPGFFTSENDAETFAKAVSKIAGRK